MPDDTEDDAEQRAGSLDAAVAPFDRVATPVEELNVLVVYGAALFYVAEVGQNESVKTYWDAYHYIATSLSVGYANIFPVTALGKAIGAAVMMVGPALSGRVLDDATPPAPAPPDSGDAIVKKLDEVLAELRKLNASRAGE